MSLPCWNTDHLVKDCTKRKNYHNKESILVERINENLLHVDEYVSDAESIYSIISYQDPDEIEKMDSDSDNNEFINNILEPSRKYKDKQLDAIEKLDQIKSMLTYLG